MKLLILILIFILSGCVKRDDLQYYVYMKERCSYWKKAADEFPNARLEQNDKELKKDCEQMGLWK